MVQQKPRPIESIPEQSAFIPVTQDPRGGLSIGEVTAEGAPGLIRENYIPPSAASEEQLAIDAANRVVRSHSTAQYLKHSALDNETGLYIDVRPGKVLPEFGIVTHNNFLKAMHFADSLNKKIWDERAEIQKTPKLPKRKEGEIIVNADGKVEAPELDSRVRLLVIEEKAGTPATNVEKLDAFYLLAIDNDYKLLHEHLGETKGKVIKNVRSQEGSSKHSAHEAGERAVLSRIQQFGDYIASAQIDEINLRRLMNEVYTFNNPRLKLTEALGSTHPGYGVLVRYIDTKSMKLSNLDPGFDPLRTKEIRPAQNFPDQHKVIVDRYTAPDLEGEDVNFVRKHIQHTVEELTLGYLWQPIKKTADGRHISLLEEAIQEQVKRQKFFADALHLIVGPRKRDAQTILAILGLLNS